MISAMRYSAQLCLMSDMGLVAVVYDELASTCANDSDGKRLTRTYGDSLPTEYTLSHSRSHGSRPFRSDVESTWSRLHSRTLGAIHLGRSQPREEIGCLRQHRSSPAWNHDRYPLHIYCLNKPILPTPTICRTLEPYSDNTSNGDDDGGGRERFRRSNGEQCPKRHDQPTIR